MGIGTGIYRVAVVVWLVLGEKGPILLLIWTFLPPTPVTCHCARSSLSLRNMRYHVSLMV